MRTNHHKFHQFISRIGGPRGGGCGNDCAARVWGSEQKSRNVIHMCAYMYVCICISVCVHVYMCTCMCKCMCAYSSITMLVCGVGSWLILPTTYVHTSYRNFTFLLFCSDSVNELAINDSCTHTPHWLMHWHSTLTHALTLHTDSCTHTRRQLCAQTRIESYCSALYRNGKIQIVAPHTRTCICMSTVHIWLPKTRTRMHTRTHTCTHSPLTLTQKQLQSRKQEHMSTAPTLIQKEKHKHTHTDTHAHTRTHTQTFFLSMPRSKSPEADGRMLLNKSSEQTSHKGKCILWF